MKRNQLKAGVMLSYISEAISILTGLLYTPIMLRLLGQSEYGLYQLSASVISYLGLLSLGFGSSYIRYYSRYKVLNEYDNIQKLNGMFMTIFCVIGIVCLFAGSILVLNIENIFNRSLTADELRTSRILMMIMVFNLSISFPASVFSSYITANEQYIFQRVINILRGLLNPFLTLPLLLMGYKSISVVIVQTILSIASLWINWMFCKKKIGMSFAFRNFDYRLLKELFVFSFWIFLNQIIDMINNQVDKFILGVYSGAIAVAIYGVANQISTMYITFSTSVSSVFAPRVNRIVLEKNSDEELTKLFVRVGRLQFILLFLVASGFVIFGRYFVGFWAGEGYEDVYIIVLLLIIPITVPLIQNLGIEIQRAKNKHQLRSIIYFVMAVINVIVSIPLARMYGGIGAAIGTCLSYILGNGIAMNIVYHTQVGINMLSFWKSIFSFFPAIILPILFGILISRFIIFTSIFQYCIWIMVYVSIYSISMWLFGMNCYEKELIRGIVRKVTNCKNNKKKG